MRVSLRHCFRSSPVGLVLLYVGFFQRDAGLVFRLSGGPALRFPGDEDDDGGWNVEDDGNGTKRAAGWRPDTGTNLRRNRARTKDLIRPMAAISTTMWCMSRLTLGA